MSFENELSVLSAKCRHHIRAGQIDQYSTCLKEMAMLMQREGRYMDELKLLISSFYIDLSGFSRAPYIDERMPELLRNVTLFSGLNFSEASNLFLKIIQPDSIAKHALTIEESLYLFKLCLENEVEKADYILTQI